ncbi:17094_t:CDS:2 [Funneliformis caledonium]|uniref:17094_t:CDS:1 n=1 Tax=Funneliformis caledonium TaxID=1117310 RepID=A0A9N9FGU1_9GLOM|nr:17094_t:CDS:2 [Funneliformis caledonium]
MKNIFQKNLSLISLLEAINGNSTIQDSSNTQQQNAISTSKPSKKRKIKEIETKIQVNKKQIKTSSKNPNIL